MTCWYNALVVGMSDKSREQMSLTIWVDKDITNTIILLWLISYAINT